MEELPLITDIDKLTSYVENFLSSNELHGQIKICNSLRKPLRLFKKLYPNLFYFAYGLQKNYNFFVSKEIFHVNYFDLSPRSKKMFISYTGLKIDPFSTEEQLKNAYKYLELKEWFNLLSDVLIFLGSEKDFVSKHYDLEKNMVNSIKNSPNFSSWKKLSLEKEVLTDNIISKIESNDNCHHVNRNGNCLYHNSNHEKYFISIDLKAANFIVMKLCGLIKENTWTDFVAKFTKHSYFSKLKLLRLKVLSHKDLLPNKQLIYWQNLMVNICNKMTNHNLITPENFVIFNSDEIVINTTKESMFTDKSSCQHFISNEYPELDVKTDIFQLKVMSGNRSYFVKIHPENKKVVFKCVNSKEILEAFELYEKINQNQD